MGTYRHAYQPPALGTYRRRRAACPQDPAYCTYWVRVPATGVPYLLRAVAPQVVTLEKAAPGVWASVLLADKADVGAPAVASLAPPPPPDAAAAQRLFAAVRSEPDMGLGPSTPASLPPSLPPRGVVG